MKRYLIILAIAMAAACTGCTKTDLPNAAGERTFTISLVNTKPDDTRAPGEDQYNENLIGRADLFFFDATGNTICYPEQSQLTYTTDKVVITLREQDAAVLFHKPLTLYLLANCSLPRSALSGKSQAEILNLVQDNPDTFNPSPFTVRSSFLMEGSRPLTNLSESQSDLGTIMLTRASAKVIVKITDAKVDGYTATEAAVRLNNYLDKTVLSADGAAYTPATSDYRHSAYRPVRLPEGGITYFSDPLYSYANDWKDAPAKESYMTIRVRWQHNGTGNAKDYYYRIPFNYIPPVSGGEPNRRLQRNYIYTFNVNISALGGLDPEEMLDLEPDFELKDWTTREINATLNRYDFLVVAETYVEMHDIARRLIHYSASQPITIQLDSAYYYRYLNSGDIDRIDLTSQDGGFYPTVTADIPSGNLVVDCDVPVNYVPTHIQFTVTSGTLSQAVRVVLYPRQYLSSAHSNRSDINFGYYNTIGYPTFWHNNANGYRDEHFILENFNFYTVTTKSVSPQDNFILGGDVLSGNGRSTNRDEASNNIVSPKFVIATQRGVTIPILYDDARDRCWFYMEGPYPQGSWRMPTNAEMQLIYKLQSDEYSALKNLFVIPVLEPSDNDYWWVARNEGNGTTEWRMNMRLGQITRTTTGGTKASVRCVHDVWKD